VQGKEIDRINRRFDKINGNIIPMLLDLLDLASMQPVVRLREARSVPTQYWRT
jgi:hypothetical protein